MGELIVLVPKPKRVPNLQGDLCSNQLKRGGQDDGKADGRY